MDSEAFTTFTERVDKERDDAWTMLHRTMDDKSLDGRQKYRAIRYCLGRLDAYHDALLIADREWREELDVSEDTVETDLMNHVTASLQAIVAVQWTRHPENNRETMGHIQGMYDALDIMDTLMKKTA